MNERWRQNYANGLCEIDLMDTFNHKKVNLELRQV